MQPSMKESWLFNGCDSGSNIKTVKTKENGKYILDEMHPNSSLLSHISFKIYVV